MALDARGPSPYISASRTAEKHVKSCRSCDCQIPDHAHRCPHCRAHQPRNDRVPQTVLALVAGSAAALAAIQSCPGLSGQVMAAGPAPRSAVVRSLAAPGVPGVARLRYDGGGDWYANPSSLPNLLRAIRDRAGIDVADRPAEVGPGDPDLADHPYLYATGHGNIAFGEEERIRLRRYLRDGGFLHVDDNYGLDESFRREVGRLFPDIPLVEVPLDHPVYHMFYDFPDGLPKVHEHDGKPAQGFGIFLDGRLVLFYSYQSDLGDGWEDASVHGDPPEVREQALRMGVNLFLYALASTAG